MKRKIALTAMLLVAVIGFTGCNTENHLPDSTSETIETENSAAEETDKQQEEKLEVDIKTYSSDYGYTIEYDAALFDVIHNGESDFFEEKGRDTVHEIPVYLSVTPVDGQAKEAIKGFFPSENSDLSVNETTIGVDKYPAFSVSYEDNSDSRGVLYRTVYAVEANHSAYIIDIGNGDNISIPMQGALEEFLASFTIEESIEKPVEVPKSNTGNTEVQPLMEASDGFYQSENGYSLVYDPTLFTASREGMTDSFALKEQDLSKEIPIYVCVTQMEEPVETVIEGLEHQANGDIISMENAVGKYSYPSHVVTYSTEEERGTMLMTFHVLEANGKVYMIEIGCNNDMAGDVQGAIENLIASFEVQAES